MHNIEPQGRLPLTTTTLLVIFQACATGASVFRKAFQEDSYSTLDDLPRSIMWGKGCAWVSYHFQARCEYHTDQLYKPIP